MELVIWKGNTGQLEIEEAMVRWEGVPVKGEGRGKREGGGKRKGSWAVCEKMSKHVCVFLVG